MAYLFLITHILCIIIGFVCGQRLGRNGSVGGAGGRDNQSASTGVADTEQLNREVDAAITAAVESNARAAEANKEAKVVVDRMRSIVDRHRSNDVSEGD